MIFHLRVYDNFHYADESEAYDYGQYTKYGEAINGAQAIVEEFLEENWKSGMKPDDLLVLFTQYGEDPIIIPDEPGEHESFSARKYANTIAAEICTRLEKKQGMIKK